MKLRVLLLFCWVAGCGSVTELAATTDGGGADLVEALDAPASDTTHQNQPDAGTVEDAGAPACSRSGLEANPKTTCSATCAICYWSDFSTPAPDGCTLPTGVRCAADCARCP